MPELIGVRVENAPVYEAVAAFVASLDTGTVFAVMGDGNMPWLSHYRTHFGGEVVHARHESGAASMADGHARGTGNVGVCSTTQGPGLTNAVTAITVAAHHGTPLVLLTGELPTAYARDKSGQIYQRVEQAQLMRSAGADYRSVRAAANVVADLQWAFTTALLEQRPVVLGVPVDVMRAPFDGPIESARMDWTAVTPPPVAPLLQEQLTLLVGLLRDAERPVIVAGRGASQAPARDALVSLADVLGAGLATTIRGKGLFDGHPRHLGIAGGYAAASRRETFAEADLLIMVGCSMSGHTLDWGDLAPDATVVHVNREPAAADIAVMTPDAFVRGDVLEVATATLEALDHGAAPLAQQGGWIPSMSEPQEASDASTEESRGLHPQTTIEVLDDLLPTDWHVVVGIGHFWWYPLHHLNDRPASSYTFAYDFGCIGQTLPIAIGVALADEPPRPTLVIEGDVSLMMNVQELETAARLDVPVTVLVMNDGGSGAEVHRMRAEGFDHEQVQFGRPDFASIAGAVGARSWTVRTAEELARALDEIVDRPEGLQLVDAHIDPDVASPIILEYLAQE